MSLAVLVIAKKAGLFAVFSRLSSVIIFAVTNAVLILILPPNGRRRICADPVRRSPGERRAQAGLAVAQSQLRPPIPACRPTAFCEDLPNLFQRSLSAAVRDVVPLRAVWADGQARAAGRSRPWWSRPVVNSSCQADINWHLMLMSS